MAAALGTSVTSSSESSCKDQPLVVYELVEKLPSGKKNLYTTEESALLVGIQHCVLYHLAKDYDEKSHKVGQCLKDIFDVLSRFKFVVKRDDFFVKDDRLSGGTVWNNRIACSEHAKRCVESLDEAHVTAEALRECLKLFFSSESRSYVVKHHVKRSYKDFTLFSATTC
jgi:hypothetical protein